MSAKRNSFVPCLPRWRRRARRVRGKLARVPRSVLIAGGAAILLATFALTNLLYHVIRKANELLFFVANGRDKEFLGHISSAALVFAPAIACRIACRANHSNRVQPFA
jgi:hypothetical protein